MPFNGKSRETVLRCRLAFLLWRAQCATLPLSLALQDPLTSLFGVFGLPLLLVIVKHEGPSDDL